MAVAFERFCDRPRAGSARRSCGRDQPRKKIRSLPVIDHEVIDRSREARAVVDDQARNAREALAQTAKRET